MSSISVIASNGKLISKQPRLWPRGSRGIALLFQDLGTRRGWVVSSTPRPRFTPGKNPVPIVQEARWAPGPVWTGEKSRPPPGFDPRTVQPVAQSLYRLSYPTHSLHVSTAISYACSYSPYLEAVYSEIYYTLYAIVTRLTQEWYFKIARFQCV